MRDGFIFYKSWWESIESVYGDDIETKNAMYRAIIQYGITEEKTFPCEKLSLLNIYEQIFYANQAYKKKSESGRKGGSSKRKQTQAKVDLLESASENGKQNEANMNINVNSNSNKNKNLNENINMNVNASSRSPSGTAPLDGGGPSGLEDGGYIDIDWGDDD